MSTPLWVCGHFVAKAFAPLIDDAAKEELRGQTFLLWQTKSAVQPLGTEDEWAQLAEMPPLVKRWQRTLRWRSVRQRWLQSWRRLRARLTRYVTRLWCLRGRLRQGHVPIALHSPWIQGGGWGAARTGCTQRGVG